MIFDKTINLISNNFPNNDELVLILILTSKFANKYCEYRVNYWLLVYENTAKILERSTW